LNPTVFRYLSGIMKYLLSLFLLAGCLFISCSQPDVKPDLSSIHAMDTTATSAFADSVGAIVKPQMADGLTATLWGIDSLIVSPIAIDIDDMGRLYYTTTDRQKNSEFDIRGHRDWEIRSISMQTVEDRRKFLHDELSPANSSRNKWLADVNGDSSRDWRDLAIEKEFVYRIEDINGDGIADKSQQVVADFNDEITDVAGGVLSNGNDLYLAVAPDLWKLTDKNGDGIPDEKKSLSHGYGVHIGFSGHGMSGVEIGPDGRIYWQIGDIGFSGKSSDGKSWEYPNSGVIARSEPDGSGFEIFASGLRNTHEFAFDAYGNLISEDNDGDHAGEKERLVYVVNGSDAGWRSNWQYGKYNDPENNRYKVWMDEKMYLPRFEGQAAYITPCIANFVSGPAGFLYNPGTAIGPAYKNHFFVAEFVGTPAGSAIHSFTLKPKGASFELGETKKIVSGILPTGLDFGPDGALYAADWIEGWGTGPFGRIWKFEDKSEASVSIRRETEILIKADFAKKSNEELGQYLGNVDMRVRLKAQFELAQKGDALIFKQWLSQKSNQLARIQSIWGISQLARKDKKQAELLMPYLKDSDEEIRAQVCKWLGDIKYTPAAAAIVPLLQDSYSRTRFFAAEALGRMEYEPAIQPIISMLRMNNDEDAYLRHAGSLALSRIGKAAPLIALAKDTSRAIRIAAVVSLRRMRDPGIAVFLNDNDEFIVTETARAINDDLSIPQALPALADLLSTTKFTNEALIRRAINANIRVGTEKTIGNLVGYALQENHPITLRIEAIETLSVWPKPSVLDRVDGRLRGPVQRDTVLVRTGFEKGLIGLLNNKQKDIRIASVVAIARLDMVNAEPILFSMLKKDVSPEVRRQALESLSAMKYPAMGEAIQQAIYDKEKMVRIAGIDLLSKTPVVPELMVKLLANVINTKSTEEKQAALLTLGNMPVKYSGPVLQSQLDKMSKAELSSDVYIELSEAVDSSHDASLMQQYKTIAASLSADQLTASYAGSLYGGNVEKGRHIFYQGESAQCIRCHSYNDYGGNAGPRLNGIASRLTRPQLLQALIDPSARISPGFGIVTLSMKNGNTISGVLLEENKTTLKIKSGNDVIDVAVVDVKGRTNQPSSMPDMKILLDKKQIRDVVSFLATLK